MRLTIFARFHARAGQADAVAAAIGDVVPPTRAETGCVSIDAYRSVQDPDLFFINSHWTDEAAFEAHAALPHTMAFVTRVTGLIDHPLEVARTRALDPPP